jgi:phosphatidylglycerol:prolipoprotein diacylglycerol transferase
MYPILLQLGPFTIYSLWVLAAVGFLVSLIIMNRLLQKNRPMLTFIAEHSLVIFLGGLITARIVFVFENARIFFGKPNISLFLEIFYIWDKGLSFWGGMIGIALTLAYFCRKEKENIRQWLDILVASTMGGLFFGNIGSFLDGTSYGTETNLPWGIIIDSSRFAVPIHPVQIYAAIYTFLLTLLIFNIWNTTVKKKDGNIALIGISGYAIFRFLEEFLRGDESNYFFGLREAQIYCILAVIICGIFFYLGLKKTTVTPAEHHKTSHT